MHFLRAIAVGVVLTLTGCSSDSSPAANPPKVILGGTLIDGTGRPPIQNSVVVVEDGKVSVASAAANYKIPDNAIKTNASGLFVTPARMGGRLEFGQPADLYLVQGNPLENPLVLGSPMRVMKTGEWLDAGQK